MVKTQKQTIDFKPIFDYIDQRLVEERKITQESISHLPTKDEFYEKMDQVLGEVQAMRQDFAAHKSMHTDLEQEDKNTLHKVKHLYKIFEVEEPKDLVASY